MIEVPLAAAPARLDRRRNIARPALPGRVAQHLLHRLKSELSLPGRDTRGGRDRALEQRRRHRGQRRVERLHIGHASSFRCTVEAGLPIRQRSFHDLRAAASVMGGAS